MRRMPKVPGRAHRFTTHLRLGAFEQTPRPMQSNEKADGAGGAINDS
jgi:hypothetical protein